MKWLRAKLSFAILKSVILCVRGTRTPFYKHTMEDVGLDNLEADIEKNIEKRLPFDAHFVSVLCLLMNVAWKCIDQIFNCK